MRKNNKAYIISFILFLLLITIYNRPIIATNQMFEKMEYSEEFLKWINMPEEERNSVLMPNVYNVSNNNTEPLKNPLYRARLLGSSIAARFSLKDIIPTNLVIRNQEDTQLCWALATLSSLETNLALNDYKNGVDTSKIYDFSERHMEYATSSIFANGVDNPEGYNRIVGDGGNWYISLPYLINGTGAISEEDMKFENNENIIDISEIQNKEVMTQVYDTINFENYNANSGAKRTEIMNKIKQHIKNYGSVYASIHGGSSDSSLYPCYNNDTGAKYCNDSSLHKIDHAISIIGWDDNYIIDNFSEKAKPTSKGAWIVRNSWGEKIEVDILAFKQAFYNAYTVECNNKGWTEPALIPNEVLEIYGYIVDGDTAYQLVGDNGLMYISYEDCNIGTTLYGIIKAEDTVSYDNIYQYDKYYPFAGISFNSPKVMLGNVFEKETTTPEYLTQVSLYATEAYICRVYVNPKGSSFNKSDLQLVQLKAGESETIDVGYHTLEFLNPVELTGNSFSVIVEIASLNSYNKTNIQLESYSKEIDILKNVKVESGKCFVSLDHNLDDCTWYDLGKLSTTNPSLPDVDSTIKAFTTNELMDESLKSIEIITPPNKTIYFEGENFDKTGMVVKANYRSKKNPSVILEESSYNIKNGTNLKVGQNSVTITFGDKSIEQTIYVEKNSVTELKIIELPEKTEYKEGQTFDRTGMVIEATYKDGTIKTISDYTIEDGSNLQVNQTHVTISFDGMTINQQITVIPNPLIEINVTKSPDKVEYVAGQNFDKTGMIVVGVYQDGTTQEILNYIIENGTNLTKEHTFITISYLGKTTIQQITVIEKAITGIKINKNPNKLIYFQHKEDLDLSGGSITVSYNDGSTEEILMSAQEIVFSGFDNTKLGKNVITIEYKTHTVQFEIEIIEEDKPENSDMDNVICDIEKIQAYYFTDNSQDDYVVMHIEIDNIERNLTNDKVTYYYYISPNIDDNIVDEWVRIREEQNEKDKLKFTMNSRDMSYYDDICNESVVYLYIKEVAIKGGNQSVSYAKNMKIETEIEIEAYINNIKKEEIEADPDLDNNINENEESKDDTIISEPAGKLPQTGAETYIIIAIIITSAIGIFIYMRYRYLNKYIK